MRSQLNSSSQSRPLPRDHIAPDRYIDPNFCTLYDAVQQLSIDDQADIPFIVWLVENPHSPIALPGKIDLYRHDCLHAILNRGHSLADEAFVRGFTIGNSTQTNRLHQLLFKFVSSTVYPKKYRFSWKDFQHFDTGFIYGRPIPVRDLNQLDFRAYENRTVSQMRQQLGVSKVTETEVL